MKLIKEEKFNRELRDQEIRNVMANNEKKDWLHIIYLPILITFLMAGFFLASVKIANRTTQTAAFDKIQDLSAAIVGYDFDTADPGDLKFTGRSTIFNEGHENINKIIMRDLMDDELFHYTEFMYESDAGDFREILDGFYEKSGWIKLNILNSIFWIERQEGAYSYNTFYRTVGDRLERIKFLEKSGKVKDETIGSFEILSLSEFSIFRELKDGAECLKDVKEYKYDFFENLFKEISQEEPIICPEQDSNFSG